MQRNINRFSQGQYDVLVIGGGINGAAIANMAALNGFKVALLEKNDFASGTSSKSTKLIHGGLRYLEHLEIDLVREALKERFIQLKSAPHLVRPLSFVIPVYKSDQRPLWLMKWGVSLYDFLSGKYLINKNRLLTADEVLQFVPGIKRDELVGGIMYYDAQMDDARLCLENVLSADEKGAHVANYTEVKSLIKEIGKSIGVCAVDTLGQKTFEVRAKKIVCAVGPWTNIFMNKEKSQSPPRVRNTKGVHIVYRGQISQHALVIPIQRDRRIFFVIPWSGNSLIGTTDTDFAGNPDDVSADQEDTDYLFGALKRIFPEMKIKQDNIITTFAGLRPLVHKKGSPSKVSRKHVITESYSGVIYILGGKYTTYRKIAEDAVRCLMRSFASLRIADQGKSAARPLADTQNEYPVYGSGMIKEDPGTVGEKYGLKADTVKYLMDFYGVRYKDVLAVIDEQSNLKERLCSCSKVMKAQVIYSIKVEMACRSNDVMRRLSLGYNYCKTGQCRQVIQSILNEFKF